MHMPGHLQGVHDFLGGGNSYLAAQSPPFSPEQGTQGGGRWAVGPVPSHGTVTSAHILPISTRSPRDVHCASDLPCPKLSSQSPHSKPDPPTAVPVYFWQLHPSICTGQIPLSLTPPVSSTRKSFWVPLQEAPRFWPLLTASLIRDMSLRHLHTKPASMLLPLLLLSLMSHGPGHMPLCSTFPNKTDSCEGPSG